ncbi:MAG: hypothetical protein ABGX20_15465 [Bacillus sp. (in: firmicutes)]
MSSFLVFANTTYLLLETLGSDPIRHSLHTLDYIEQEEWITHAAVIFEARL